MNNNNNNPEPNASNSNSGQSGINKRNKCPCDGLSKDKQRKVLRDSGQSYVNRKGKVIPEKPALVTATVCGEKCSKNCKDLELEFVKKLNDQFYAVSYNEQSLILLKYINIEEPKRRRKGKKHENSRRLFTFKYLIDTKNVCLKTFCHIFSVSRRRVEVLQNKIKNGEIDPSDGRGRHFNRPHAVKNSLDLSKRQNCPITTTESKDRMRKVLRDSGQTYVNRKGKVVPEKPALLSAAICSEKCSKDCKTLNFKFVKNLNKKFYSVSYNEQSLMLLKYISIDEPKRRRKGKQEENSRKQVSFKYEINNKKVCVKTFCHIFSISRRRVEVLQKNIKNGEISPSDGRGRHTNRPHAVEKTMRDAVRSHIASFPTEKGHSSDKSSDVKYLSPDLTIVKMHKLFMEAFPSSKISLNFYKKIFYREFKLRSRAPRSEILAKPKRSKASGSKTSVKCEQDCLHSELENGIHHINPNGAYHAFSAYSSNAHSVNASSADLQQTSFTTPTSTAMPCDDQIPICTRDFHTVLFESINILKEEF